MKGTFQFKPDSLISLIGLPNCKTIACLVSSTINKLKLAKNKITTISIIIKVPFFITWLPPLMEQLVYLNHLRAINLLKIDFPLNRRLLYSYSVKYLPSVSYTHLTLPTKRIV